MKGFVPTPPRVANQMVLRLFRHLPPRADSVVLDAGCGDGRLIEAILRHIHRQNLPLPKIVGVDSDPRRIAEAKARLWSRNLQFAVEDFLDHRGGPYDYVISNPPYVPISQLSEDEKRTYRAAFEGARGRFDLYHLFFFHALRLLKPGGRLVFLTPEKYLYVEAASELRRQLASLDVEEIVQLPEDTFEPLATYPALTVVKLAGPNGGAAVRLRDGVRRKFRPPSDGSTWMPFLRGGARPQHTGPTLKDLADRISCGIATGRDDVFVAKRYFLSPKLSSFAFPSIAGRQLNPEHSTPRSDELMLVPYASKKLRPVREMMPLYRYLSVARRKLALEKRTCSRRKPWYAFHETPNLTELLQPKILWKDICRRPKFWLDARGELMPRHSVYYLIPKRPADAIRILKYLNSSGVSKWLEQNAQRTGSGFLRLQARLLQRLPLNLDSAGKGLLPGDFLEIPSLVHVPGVCSSGAVRARLGPGAERTRASTLASASAS